MNFSTLVYNILLFYCTKRSHNFKCLQYVLQFNAFYRMFSTEMIRPNHMEGFQHLMNPLRTKGMTRSQLTNICNFWTFLAKCGKIFYNSVTKSNQVSGTFFFEINTFVFVLCFNFYIFFYSVTKSNHCDMSF
jgi:hypothetical protein